MEDCSLDAKMLSVPDASFEADFPIYSSFSRSPFPHPPDHHDESPKSAEQEGSKNVKYNLRKSLAWDSEFFNSPGVLEPDELTSMIESAEKTEKSALPKFQERQKSTDSKSALVTESLKIASLQDGLSEDTKAPAQRSGKASRVENSSGKARSVVSDSHTNQSPKKKELASRGKLKPKPSSMKLSVGTPKSGKAANPQTIHPRVLQLRNNYSGGQSGSPPSKPPRPEMHSPVVSSTKGDSKAERKNAEGATGRRVSSSKIHTSSFSQSMISSGPSSSRSTSSSTVVKKAMNSSVDSFVSASSSTIKSVAVINEPKRSSFASAMNSSVDSFISASSSSTIKSAAVITEPKRSTYASVLKKPAPRTSPASSVGDWSSKSTSSIPVTLQRSKSARASIANSSPDTPSRPLVTSKQSNDTKMLSGQKTRVAASTPNGRSSSMGRGTNSVKQSSASQIHPQMHRSYSTKLSSSSTSTASSSPDSSVRSSSSLSTTKPRSSSATPRMGNSYQKEATPGPLKSPKPSNDQQLDGQKTKMPARPAQHGRSASTGRLVMKPSALRMPSPKMGFFDGGKSGRTPKGTKQPPTLVPGGLPKAGAKNVDSNESINKVKAGSIKSPRSTMPIGSKKGENNKQSRSHQEPSSATERASSASSQRKIQDSKPAKWNANKEGGSTSEVQNAMQMGSRDKESPSDVQSVKNKGIGVKVGGEDPAAKLEQASNELVKTVDSSQQVSQISSSEVSLATLSSAKGDQSTSGGRMPFAAIHCNKDESSDGLTGLGQAEKRITIMSSYPEDVLDHV